MILNMEWKEPICGVHSLHCYVNIHIFHYRTLDYLTKKVPQGYSGNFWARLELLCGGTTLMCCLLYLSYVLLSWNSVRLPKSEKDNLKPRRWRCTVPLTP